jgi:group I intron endonuclease
MLLDVVFGICYTGSMKQKLSGVYTITNAQNGNVYVGSTVDLDRRWSVHKACLRKHKHYSKLLQEDWDNFGEDCFSCQLVEPCSKETLDVWEQRYIDFLKPTYNVTRTVLPFSDPEFQKRLPRGRDLRDYTPEFAEKMRQKASKQRHSPETRKKIGDLHRDIPLSEEHKRHVSESMTNNPNVMGPKSEAHKAAIKRGMKEKWQDPEYRAMMTERRRQRPIGVKYKTRTKEKA